MSAQKEKLIASFQELDNNPFIFSSHKIIPHKEPQLALTKQERSIIREQHQTLFEYDEAMQKLFNRNFEEYFKAIIDPNLMITKMNDTLHEFEDVINTNKHHISQEDRDELNDILMQDLEEQELLDETNIDDTDMPELGFEQDELYQKVISWSDSLHDISHDIYEHKGHRDPHIFRIAINSCVVATKVAYAIDIDEDLFDLADINTIKSEIKTSIQSYELSLTFLQRVRESLSYLCRKKIAPTQEWRNALGQANEIILEIQHRIMDFKSKLNPPSK